MRLAVFFIVSSGRSGSTTLARALHQFGDCICYHHPKPELVREATRYHYGDIEPEVIAATLGSTRAPTLRGRQYGEANLQHSLLIPVIDQVFPEAKLLWLTRDGRDVVASMYYRGWYDPSETKIPDEWHESRLRGDLTGEMTTREWNEYSRFEKCCWLWRSYNEIIEAHLGKLDCSRWMRVRLESMRSSLNEVAAFLEVTPPRRTLVERTNTAFQPVTPWTAWEYEQKVAFEALCGDAMDALYPTWRDESGEWLTLTSETPDQAPLSVVVQRQVRQLAKSTLRRVTGRAP